MTTSGLTPDVRPALRAIGDRVVVEGSRCSVCGLPSAERLPSCARCGGRLSPEQFGPLGTVWSWTTVNIAFGERPAGHTFAYVDLEDGPRILALLPDPSAVGASVVVRGFDERGDVLVEEVVAP